MADLFLLDDTGRVTRLPCPDDRPLRLDDAARPVDANFHLAVVPFAVAPRAPRRWALVVVPGARVAVGATRVYAGIVELHDRDRVLVGERETVFSTDALPAPVTAEDPEGPCPVCCEALAADGGSGLFRCCRCGMRACSRCWELAPRRVCLTPGCGQPAALHRALWEPTCSEFATWNGEEDAP